VSQTPQPGNVIVALLTPYSRDGRVDEGALREHVTWLTRAGVDGFMVAGTTGEGPLLEEQEVVDAVATVVEAAAPPAVVLAHIGRPATGATLRLAARALHAGADGVAAVVPYYYAIGDQAQVAHFRALLVEVNGRVPVWAYTIPARTGNQLSVHAVSTLGGDGLAGVKDSSKSFSQHQAYLGTGLPILMGSDGMVLQALEAGATGCVSAIANLRPELLVGLTRAIAEGTSDTAHRLQDEILRLRSELSGPSTLAKLKRLVQDQIPGYESVVRAPLG
jgi:dihydrodipicolinate synthase/N-acetylneuraminate lyase